MWGVSRAQGTGCLKSLAQIKDDVDESGIDRKRLLSGRPNADDCCWTGDEAEQPWRRGGASASSIHDRTGYNSTAEIEMIERMH